MGDEEEKQQPRVLQMVRAEGSDKSCVTFVLHNEDHTLGNSLRYMIMKNPEVEFCGYSITHPSESKINFRVQTRGGLPAVEAFQKGLEDLMGVCQHVLSTFKASVEEYKTKNDETME
ncbi:DNA-directed RNA polymerases I and III subunit RPAC2-like [Python bivittatus]|uniref:DNA-directed RNA polymerases I and III subunit RPAC2 n=1 Tax=Python bivittatus TaxID=176946 RepID=A0A9F2R3H6_PYTBI|nr:DNA-directed RNA polymerases I and III subunit RPAC2-like [Python bivittatus]